MRSLSSARRALRVAYAAGKTELDAGRLEQALVDLDTAKTDDPDKRADIDQALQQALTALAQQTPSPGTDRGATANRGRHGPSHRRHPSLDGSGHVPPEPACGTGLSRRDSARPPRPASARPPRRTLARPSWPASARPSRPARARPSRPASARPSRPAAGTSVPTQALATWTDPRGPLFVLGRARRLDGQATRRSRCSAPAPSNFAIRPIGRRSTSRWIPRRGPSPRSCTRPAWTF